jgi:capsular polysaccharide transport system permease protein
MIFNAIKDEFTDFSRALRRSASVIVTLLRREEVKRREAPVQTILGLFEPIFLISMIGMAYWFLERNRAPVGGSPALFFASGLYIKYYFIHVSRRIPRTRNRRFPAELWLDQVIVFMLIKFIDYLLLGILMVAVLALFIDPNAVPYDLKPIFESMGYMTMLGFGWGVIILALRRAFKLQAFLFSVINRILVLLSGAMFVVDFMHPAARYWLSFNPMLHAIILFRTGFYPRYPTYTLDMPYLISCSIGAVVLGLVVERAFRRRLENV